MARQAIGQGAHIIRDAIRCGRQEGQCGWHTRASCSDGCNGDGRRSTVVTPEGSVTVTAGKVRARWKCNGRPRYGSVTVDALEQPRASKDKMTREIKSARDNFLFIVLPPFIPLCKNTKLDLSLSSGNSIISKFLLF